MPRTQRLSARLAAEFGIAALCAAGAVALGLVLMPVTGFRLPYLAIFTAVMIATLMRGITAGILCFILAMAASVLFFLGQVASTSARTEPPP